MVCAQCFTKASSSSFGTLVAISFMTIAKETKGKKELYINELILPLLLSLLLNIENKNVHLRLMKHYL